MTTTPRSPRLLLLSTVMLAVAGVALPGVPHGQEQPAPASTAHAVTDPSSAATVPSASKPTAGTAPAATSAASAPPVVESALPPHGEGVAGDLAVQLSLEAAWPADLPARDEQQLRAAGHALLRADATGVGRAEWPEVWPDSGQVVVPAFATARFRIQAAIARRDGARTRRWSIWVGRAWTAAAPSLT
ncbi:hypothetical protein ACGF8D_26040 [Streptomyces massasporeus]|uniref:hypothetical protein n=1 Tax=Streptomyces massasporeus TaxID=67324 RepID=UPI003714A365